MKNYIYAVLIGFVVGGIVFFNIGRSTVTSEPIIKYAKGETTTGSVNSTQLNPVSEIVPDKPKYPTKVVKENVVVDTAAIIAEYEKIRSYSVVAFDNKEQGKLTLFPKLQYNALSSLDYEFTPMQKQTTIYKTKIWQPFGSVSYSTLNYVGIGGGLFYHNLGFEYQFQKSFSDKLGNGHFISGKYRF